MSEEIPAGVELAIGRLQRTTEVGFTRLDGQLALILQRGDQQEIRTTEHAARLEDHDKRIRSVEHTTVTDAEQTERLDAHEERLRAVEQAAVTDADLDARTRRIWMVLGGLGGLAGVALGLLTFIYSTLP